jgi:hypothetical protein
VHLPISRFAGEPLRQPQDPDAGANLPALFLVASVLVTASRHATAPLSATAMLGTAPAPLSATTLDLCTDLRMAPQPAASLNPDIATTSAALNFATAMTSAVEFASIALSTTPAVPALAAAPA